MHLLKQPCGSTLPVKRPLLCPSTASSKQRQAESVCSTESYRGSRPEDSPEDTSSFTKRHLCYHGEASTLGLTMTPSDVKCFAQYVRTTKRRMLLPHQAQAILEGRLLLIILNHHSIQTPFVLCSKLSRQHPSSQY